MVAAVASAAAGNDLEREAWEVGPSSWWWVLSAGGPGLGPQPSLVSLSAHRTAGAWLPNSTNSGGDCPAHSSTGSAFPSWGSSRLWDSGEQGLGETPVGKSWWIVGRTRLNPFPVLQQGTGLGTNTSLAQMVSGLVGQLLMQPVLVGESCSSLAQTLCVTSCSW